jgi:hypothetical protein
MRNLIFITALLACPPAYSNEIYITQSGNEFSATIVQKGEDNLIEGLNGTGTLTGNLNSLEINQGYEGNNYVELAIDGDSNEIIVGQEKVLTDGASGITWTDDTNSYGNHYASVELDGSGNSVAIEQRNNNDSTAGHSSSVRFRGNNNSAVTLQTGSGGSAGHLTSIYTHDTESNNIVDVFQNSDTAYHRAYVSMYNDGNNIDIDQTGTTQNNAYVIFSGYSTDFTLTQNGGDTYGNPSGSSANINCGNINGCTVAVTQ